MKTNKKHKTNKMATLLTLTVLLISALLEIVHYFWAFFVHLLPPPPSGSLASGGTCRLALISIVCVCLFVWLLFFSAFMNINLYYFVCAIGGQHDGHLPFWLSGFVGLIMLLLHVLFAC